MVGSTFNARRARHLRLVFLGNSQNGNYFHSVRELMAVSGCCDATEITFHRNHETDVCDFADFDDRYF